MEAHEGLVAFVVDTDRPVVAVHYVSPDNDNQFSLLSAEQGTSIQVHRVPADRYCIRAVKWPVGNFNADYRGKGPILCMEVKPGVLNYPGHLQLADGKNTLSRSGFKGRYLPAVEDFEERLRGEYPELVPLL
ncbi:MAG: hypothetical protein AAF799_01250 [Myxococcota bacterium]